MAASSQLSRRRSTFLLQMAEAADRERGERIKELRGHKPQPVMADAVGVSLRAYQEWEAGGGIRWENIKALAKVHGVDPNLILSGPKDETPDLIRSLNGDGDLAQINKRLAHIEASIAELVNWSQGGPTRKELESRINALADLAAETLGGQRRLHAQLLEQSLDEEHPDRTAEERSPQEGPRRAREAG